MSRPGPGFEDDPISDVGGETRRERGGKGVKTEGEKEMNWRGKIRRVSDEKKWKKESVERGEEIETRRKKRFGILSRKCIKMETVFVRSNMFSSAWCMM